MPYLSPTIGLWIPPADYIKFIYDLKKYVTVDLERIYVADSRISDMLMERSQKKGIDPQSIIIGKIEDVEIIFQHYKSFEDARDKWYRRRERINWNNIVIKMNDQNGCTRQHYEKFMQANYANKLFITANIDYRNNENTVYVEKYREFGYVVNDVYENDRVPLDVTQYLNSMIREK